MHLYTEAKSIANEAWEESNYDEDQARDFLYQSCDGHEVSIHHHKAIQFCADQDTGEGEEWLDGIGGIAQHGDTLGMIACRIAFATLFCACFSALSEIIEHHEQET